jgi:hypothetical protein
MRTSENVDNLLISTKLSQVMSRIQRKGFGSTAFRSNDAPPAWQQHKEQEYLKLGINLNGEKSENGQQLLCGGLQIKI